MLKRLLLLVGIVMTTQAIAQTDSLAVSPHAYPLGFEKEELKGINDTTTVLEKKFSESEVETLKEDSDLNYQEAPTMAESLWDRFLKWLLQLLGSLFENVTGTGVGRLLLYALGFGVLVAIVMALLKVNAFRVFYAGADKGKGNAVDLHENIHEMQFDELIRDCVERKEYRLATRLTFLYALRLLSDKHLVTWYPGKTNHDYVEELSVKELKTGFNELSFYFEYAWYGNFIISAEIFGKVQGIFNDWKSKIGS